MEIPGDNNQEVWEAYIGNNPFQKLTEFAPTLVTPEIQEFMDWYFSQREALPPFDEGDGPITDGKEWVHKINPEGQLESIGRADEDYFGFRGKRFQSGDFIWGQPVREAKHLMLPVVLDGKERTMPISGVLVIVPDTEGKTLMAVGREPTSDFYKKAIIRFPVQSSQGKLKKVFEEGKEDADPALRSNLTAITSKTNLGLMDLIKYTLLNGQHSFYLGADDTNFEYKHTLCVVWEPIEVGTEKHKALGAGGRNKFLSRDQIDFATMAGLTNGHTDRAFRRIEIRSRNTT